MGLPEVLAAERDRVGADAAGRVVRAVEKQQISMMAHISLNFVMKATYGSKPLLVTVQKP